MTRAMPRSGTTGGAGRAFNMRAVAGAVVLMAAVFLAAATAARAEPVRLEAGGIRVRAEQTGPTGLRLDLWPAPEQSIESLRAAVGDVAADVAAFASHAMTGETTAVLLLVDTSDPARRRPDVRRIGRHIGLLLEKSGEHHRFGLAQFSGKLEMIAPVGTDKAKLGKAARGLEAKGLTTELFRSVSAAVEQVGQVQAARRVVIVFSDGQHEDPAFSHEDVVKTARAAGVAVYAVGYSRARDGSRWFQNLERMSAGTGGLFVAANRKLNLPKKFTDDVFAALDAGGRTEVDLAPLVAARLGGAQTLTLTVAVAGGAPVRIPISVTLPVVTLGERLTDPGNRLYVIGAGAVALVIAAFAAMVLLRWRRGALTRRAAAAAAQVPYAFLEFFDDTESRHPVLGTALRLGRNADNDVPIANTSVSAYHAEIQRRRDGTFIVTDLDSLNGVTVNDETVDVGRLDDGDVVELGEVRFRFRLNPERQAETPDGADVDDAPPPT